MLVSGKALRQLIVEGCSQEKAMIFNGNNEEFVCDSESVRGLLMKRGGNTMMPPEPPRVIGEGEDDDDDHTDDHDHDHDDDDHDAT